MTRAAAWLLLWAAGGVGVGLTLVALALILSPPYAGITGAVELDPLLTLAHFRVYLARTAIFNTLLLTAAVMAAGTALAWLWARPGPIAPGLRPLLLLPLLLPGPVVALLGRPFFVGWLNLRDATFTLLVTGLILLWRVTPLLVLAAHPPHRRRAALGLAAGVILLDGGLSLLLAGGAPYNAAHTWASWLLQQVWTMRAWGHAAHLAAALAGVAAVLVWVSLRDPASTQAREPLPSPPPRARELSVCHTGDGSPPLGEVEGGRRGASLLALGWVLGPFLVALVRWVGASDLGVYPWRDTLTQLFSSALFTLAAALIAWGLTWAWAKLGVTARRGWLMLPFLLLPLWTVSAAYLAPALPDWGRVLALPLLVGLLAAPLTFGLVRRQTVPPGGWAGVVLASTLLVQAQSFPLQLVLDLPSGAWTPTLGLAYGLAAAPASMQAPALLLHSLLALGSAWWVLPHPAIAARPASAALEGARLPS